MSIIRIFFALLICFSVAFTPACHRKPKGAYVFNDFEEDVDLDRLVWKCRSLFSLSPLHAANGRMCLKMELYPDAYPGVAFIYPRINWSGFERLQMEIYNPEENKGDCRVTIRIDDREKAPPFEDRFNGTYLLKPGLNHLDIPLADLKTPAGRPLRLKHIFAFMLFMSHPPEKKTLYLDHVRLTSQGS